MARKLSLKDLSLKNKRVLMRVDFNVPLTKEGSISDDTRIVLSLPSIEYVLNQGGSLILMSHLGRPEGKYDKQYSLAPCAKKLSLLLKKEVIMAPDCVGSEVEKIAQALKPNQILLLENLRFYEAEEHPEKDPTFAKKLASLGDFYVNDAFGTAHRSHSSTATITKYFSKKSAMGLLMEKEVTFLKEVLDKPKRPFYAIIGGAKISSKIGILSSLLSKVDSVFIGGGMAFTFLKALYQPIGQSICDDSMIETAKNFLESAKTKGINVYLPTDFIIAKSFNNDAASKIILTQEGIPDGWQGLDIGPNTLKNWASYLQDGAIVFWNGPLGVFEFPNFASGTFEIAKIISSLKATTIVGGGDSVSAINKLGLIKKFSHVSSGGGASLELIEYGHLPGIDALSDCN